MIELLQRLWQRKLVQWMLAYIAAAFALIQVVDVVGGHFGWPAATGRYLILALTAGFFVALVVSWYHGERGAQRFGGGELLIIALLLAIGGFAVGHFGPMAGVPQAAPGQVAAAPALDGSGRADKSVVPTSAVRSMPMAMAQPIPTQSIAVLPFENLSSDKENDYFVSGMQDMILAKLADIGEFKVISRTSTMKYKSRPDNLRKVATELGVATILEGSVQKQGKQVLINVQLIDARSDAHLWAETYTRTLHNVFGVEGEVTEKITGALHAKLSPMQSANLSAAPTSDQIAYDLFLRAEYLFNKGNVNYDTDNWKAAIPRYQEAVARDPGFALAVARLSQVESRLGKFGGAGEEPRQLFARARKNAEQALKLAPNLAASHIALGYSDYFEKGDYAAAQKSFEAAMALRPSDVDALTACGFVQRKQGQFDASIAKFTQALAHDPRNSALAFELGLTYSMVGRYADAKGPLRRAIALDPDNLYAQSQYSVAVGLESGDMVGALAAAEGDTSEMKELRVILLTFQRKFHEAIALHESIPDTPDILAPKTAHLAILHWYAGDKAQARKLFTKALALDRASLSRAQGINQAVLWNRVAVSELGLGDTAAGLAAIAKAEAILDRIHDFTEGPGLRNDDAGAYAMAGRADLAVPLLAKALATPGLAAFYSPALLWLDPRWDPIRSDPGFQALLAKYAKSKPAVTYEIAAARG